MHLRLTGRGGATEQRPTRSAGGAEPAAGRQSNPFVVVGTHLTEKQVRLGFGLASHPMAARQLSSNRLYLPPPRMLACARLSYSGGTRVVLGWYDGGTRVAHGLLLLRWHTGGTQVLQGYH